MEAGARGVYGREGKDGMKDATGNELKVGDLVALQLERPLIFGRVQEIYEGGRIVGVKGGEKAELHPSRVVITSNHTIEVHPNTPLIGAVLCLREDNPPPIPGQETETKPADPLPN